jgi:hypothetical protein
LTTHSSNTLCKNHKCLIKKLREHLISKEELNTRIQPFYGFSKKKIYTTTINVTMKIVLLVIQSTNLRQLLQWYAIQAVTPLGMMCA